MPSPSITTASDELSMTSPTTILCFMQRHPKRCLRMFFLGTSSGMKNPSARLGVQGADEVKAHLFFEGLVWDKVTTAEAAFIPQVTDPESTDYFDPRGAIPQLFHDGNQVAIAGQSALNSPVINPLMPPPPVPIPVGNHDPVPSSASDDFGSFSFKNLPILKQANNDVIWKLSVPRILPPYQQVWIRLACSFVTGPVQLSRSSVSPVPISIALRLVRWHNEHLRARDSNPRISTFNMSKCPGFGNGSCKGIVKQNLGATKFVCDPGELGFTDLGRVLQLCLTHKEVVYLTPPLSFDDLRSPQIQTILACPAAAPNSNVNDWYLPANSSPTPTSSKSANVSHHSPSPGIGVCSSSRIPQPFPDILPLDKTNWPHCSGSRGSMSSATKQAETSTPASTSVKIICWLQVVLQQRHIILGKAGIEKVGSFSRYDPMLHDWVLCPWVKPFSPSTHTVVTLRWNGVYKLAGWSKLVQDIAVQIEIGCHAWARALLDEALASEAITPFTAPVHLHIDVDTQGVATMMTLPAVDLYSTGLTPIMLELEDSKPNASIDAVNVSQSDDEDEEAKPPPEVWNDQGFFMCKDIHELGYAPQLGHHANLPQLVFSFKLLRQLQLLHVECTANMHDMMGAWQRLTDNKYPWNASGWEKYLEEAESIKPKGDGKKIPCNNHKAVTSQNAYFENCEYMGVAQVQCSHVFVRATADFLKGEVQWTMDNALHHALLLANLVSDKNDSVDIVFSYNINCQYSIHIPERFEVATLQLSKHHAVRSIKIIPLCHIKGYQEKCNEDFNLAYINCISHFHGETAVQFWAFSNGLGPQIHQMNLEHGHEIYFHHANDWNYCKLINISHELQKDIQYAHQQLAQHGAYFQRLTASLPQEQVAAWEKLPHEPPLQGSRKGASEGYVSPYRHRKLKVPSMDNAIEALLLNLRKLVAISAGSDEAAEFVSEGINLEQQQRHLQILIEKEKIFPNETDKETIRHKRTSLEKSIWHWLELWVKFMGVASKFPLPTDIPNDDKPLLNDHESLLTDCESAEQPEKPGKKRRKKKKASSPAHVERWSLHLPSALSLDDDKAHLKPLMEYETKLHEGAAFNSLHAVILAADQLRALGHNKSKNVHGYKPNTKAQEKLRCIKFQRNLGISDWNVHRNALIAMGMIDDTQLKGLLELKKEDTARKAVDAHRQSGLSRIVDGAAYTWFWQASIQTTAKGMAPRGKHKRMHEDDDTAFCAPASGKWPTKGSGKTPKKLKTTGGSSVKATEADNVGTAINDDSEANCNGNETKSTWVYELHEHGNINKADLQEWIYEGNRVQWFCAEAEMLRWQEHHEIKQAEFVHVLQSFEVQKSTWLKAANKIYVDESYKIGYIAYAKEQAAMLDDMIK
ncbi:hypothetical protein IW262DRAFT_1300341 [Armillaria fumosa]|nr:hypothetical protein IW262DRAFT_1300341 [Armillaria fumosa]